MWRMLCAATREKGADVWKLSASGVEAGAISGKARWVADYRFSATGRLVHNVIDSRFEFNPDGLIQRQRDTFDLWKWSRQALGRARPAAGLDTFFAPQDQDAGRGKSGKISSRGARRERPL